jgi:hypothetical protein
VTVRQAIHEARHAIGEDQLRLDGEQLEVRGEF